MGLLKKIIKDTAIKSRLIFSSISMQPDFIIIGAQKSGTTSLFNYLVNHPHILKPLTKEVHYFDNNYDKPLKWYYAHFPSKLRKKQAEIFLHADPCITGEASPYYLYHPLVPSRLYGTLPDIRLIVLLRNPIDRAFSHYYHEKRKGREQLSFEDAIMKESYRLKGEVGKIIADSSYYSYNHQRFSYIGRGIYFEQLQRWFQYYPREDFLILQSEQFFDDPVTTYAEVLDFLKLPIIETDDFKKFGEGKYSQMPDKARNYLAELFLPHNRRLFDLLGVDFDWN